MTCQVRDIVGDCTYPDEYDSTRFGRVCYAHYVLESRPDAERAIEAMKMRLKPMAGDPAVSSPEYVDHLPDYERVTEQDGGTYPASVLHVVRHKPTGTLWACTYGIYDDSSDYGQSTQWYEVEERQVVVTKYEKKSG